MAHLLCCMGLVMTVESGLLESTPPSEDCLLFPDSMQPQNRLGDFNPLKAYMVHFLFL